MTDSQDKAGQINVVWRQLLIGQTFGLAWAVLLFIVEPLISMRHVHEQFGATMTSVFAAYASFGWVLGSGLGLLWGLLGAIVPRIKRDDETVPGLGPVLGMIMMALFIMRWETAATVRTFPTSVLVSLAAAVFVWIGLWYLGRRFLARYVRERYRWPSLKLLALIAFFTVVGPLGLSRMETGRLPKRTASSADSPNLVLIVVDALRPDHLTPYGYRRDTSPNLERFAETATVFERAYSQGNRTVIAMPSLFTSLYPSYHGVVGFQKLMIPLPKSRTTIADVCRRAGYTTVGIMSNVYLKTPFGLTKGFDRVEEFNTRRYHLSVYRACAKLGIIEKPDYKWHLPDATQVTDRSIEWLHRVADRPFFLFVHYMDVHHPYTPPEEFRQMFDRQTSDIDPDVLFAKTAAMVTQPPPLSLPKGELQRLVDLYDGCIRYTDEEIGRFLDELESLQLDRETVVIFTADHGDEFLENGSLYHNNLATETLLRVPLIIGRYPARPAPRKTTVMARHVDVLPTAAELIGQTPPEGIHGKSLVPVLRGEQASGGDYSIAEGDYCTSLNKGHWKLLHVDSTDTYQLFDLSTDPAGLVDVSERYPAEFAGMKAIVDGYLRAVADLEQGDAQPMSEETVRKLKALGYIQ